MNDHDILAYHYKVAIATGLSKPAAKRYANHQLRENYNINHLRVM